MAETYSLGVTGRRADSPFTLTPVTLGDSIATPGGETRATQLNTQALCKNLDGSFSWYTIDAERSVPGAVVMKAV